MPKYYDHDCLPNFFRSLLTTRVAKNSHILTTTYFTFPQKRRWRNLKSFTTKFRIRSKDRKSNYELRPILVLFCNFVALVLGSSCVKGLIITKFVKQIKFEETWGWKESKNCLQRQSWSNYFKHLFFSYEIAHSGKSSMSIFQNFLPVLTKFSFCEEGWTLGSNSMTFWDIHHIS